ncbi:MAG: hypothetical protein DHS20C05_08210 [Hyphococcus sp.]|nr:MAG: hypothetical protein DHS20C05_08210 [Marinicaulis sp.]
MQTSAPDLPGESRDPEIAPPSIEALEKVQATLSAAGMILPDVQNISGAHCLFLPDPDGLRVEITYEPVGT